MVAKVINIIDDRFKLDTIVKGPGCLRFFGIIIIQSEEFSIETNTDDKLEAIEDHQYFVFNVTKRKTALVYLFHRIGIYYL